jgi:hypothetical protein
VRNRGANSTPSKVIIGHLLIATSLRLAHTILNMDHRLGISTEKKIRVYNEF